MASSASPHSFTFLAGGTGTTGRRVAQRLRRLGHPVRVGSRRAAVPFDWADATTFGPALAGTTRAYVAFAPDIAMPGALDQIGHFVAAAEREGLERLVLLSGRGEPSAQAAEQLVLDSAIEAAVVRCSFFAQNFSEHVLLDDVRRGRITLPAGAVAEPILDADDIADVAVRALLDRGHAGAVHELTGPELLTFDEIAAVLSEAVGRPIEYVPVTPAEWAAGAVAAGLPPDEARGLAELFAFIFDGHNASLTTGVADVLGRPPRSFADVARDAAAAGAWGAAEVAS